MKIYLSTHLRIYTHHKNMVEADGATLAVLLWDMDRRYPGIRFRIIDEQDSIREHIKIFIDEEQVHGLNIPLAEAKKIHIIGALSGGTETSQAASLLA